MTPFHTIDFSMKWAKTIGGTLYERRWHHEMLTLRIEKIEVRLLAFQEKTPKYSNRKVRKRV